MKLSIVTPTHNSSRFLSETILSVVSQRCAFDIEYIIVDNCSVDGTLEIVKSYIDLVDSGCFNSDGKMVTLRYVSERDSGMYAAINKGFGLAGGDIHGWINSDDFYLPGAFESVGKTFVAFPTVKWLKGITSYADESSRIMEIGKCYLYDQEWIRAGIYGKELFFIQQDSVFWRSDLWDRVEGIDSQLRLAGDYYLWTRFAQSEALYSMDSYVSCFRRVRGQLSEQFVAYLAECDTVGHQEVAGRSWIRRYFRVIEPLIPEVVRPLAYRLAFANRALPVIDLSGSVPTMRHRHYYVA